jgi:hypothetical protein
MADKLERENRRADKVNPDKSGIRTGNPQLDPHAGRKPTKPADPDKPHAPEGDPQVRDQ